MSKEPYFIDLDTTVPMLIETGNYSSIVDLCLRKITYIKNMEASPDEEAALS
jgi:hypothetical protein